MALTYTSCRLCGRNCGIDRTKTVGFCRMPSELYVSRAALHMWEEPPISGTRGSGTVFFSGCSIGCVFCQNRAISKGVSGVKITKERLSEIMLELEESGAHNINLVTPTHYAPTIGEAIIYARSRGLSVPIVYNTGSYDTRNTVKMLDGLVDIYLPDMKYYLDKTAKKFSGASDYPEVSRAALEEMVNQVGTTGFDSSGMMIRGVMVRVLLLPGHVAEAKLIVKYLYTVYGDSIYISLMNQYTPMPGMNGELSRRVTHKEYDELVEYAVRLGVKNCFIQEFGTAKESFIPDFDNSGVISRR